MVEVLVLMKEFRRNLNYDLRSLREWLNETPGVAFLLVLGVIFLICLVPPWDWSIRLRTGGLVLQLGGLFTVAKGLRETRRMFEVPSTSDFASSRVRALWKIMSRPRNFNVTLGGASINSASLVGNLKVTATPPKLFTTGERLNYLEQKQRELQRRIEQIDDVLDEKIRVLSEELTQEKRGREESDARLQEILERLSVGGLYLEVIGLWCLVTGVILSTIPSEIVAVFAG